MKKIDKKIIKNVSIALGAIFILIVIVCLFNKKEPKKEEEIVNIYVTDISSSTLECTNREVTITVKGESDKGKITSYSYDDGKNWSNENTYSVIENKTLNIRVKDEHNHISEPKQYSVTNINDLEPTITFRVATEVKKGESFDLRSDVVAIDKCSGRALKYDVTPSTLNTKTLGEHTIIYTVYGNNGKTAKKIRKIVVID